MAESGPQFWIDVGGTFTDCVMRRPDGRLVTHKLLSSGWRPTVAGPGSTGRRWRDWTLRGAPAGYFIGYELVYDEPVSGHAYSPASPLRARVSMYDPESGELGFEEALPFPPRCGTKFALDDTRAVFVSPEESPVSGIRWLLGKRVDEPLGPVTVRLGTTRATNALLQRRGARTALVVTAGFADGLRIGYQDRPDIFALHIPQPPELYEHTIEVCERLDASGDVLLSLDESDARARLASAQEHGIESLAICLLHAYRNPVHELALQRIAVEVGFRHISLSSRVSPLPKFVYRGDTTLLDAYLTPVLAEYAERLAAQMPEANLRFMTSSGALVRAADFRGVGGILSGPAGGVVGAARMVERAGLAPAFAFDMGGTSTDVSRWDGTAPARRYEAEFGGRPETQGGEPAIRRMRLQSSMLEIETVAAGGGSLCVFDGQKLTVGPQSAGADPGPACYGRGGPLTITDCNFILGKIPKFPFELDRAAVEQRLDALREAIVRAGGPVYSREALAAGFVRVANANMAAPIRRLAAARGEDLREHTLVAFGGAGGQHGCALARELGMRRVLCVRHAGVLSAVGIGLAVETRFAERALSADDEPARVFAVLKDELAEQMRADGIAPNDLDTPRRMLEMRYAGQESRLTISEPPDGDYHLAFTREHQRVYDFAFPDRRIEAYAARVEWSTRPVTLLDEGFTPVGPTRTIPLLASLEEAWHGESPTLARTFVYQSSDLRPGMRFAGPAIVLEPVATVVVDPGWKAEVTPAGDLLLTVIPDSTSNASSEPSVETAPAASDPIELELFHNRFASIAEQMGAALQRTALSTNVKERLDFSCALFDRAGRLIANAAHIPVHLGAMEECVRCLLEDQPELRPGDVFLTNDPFRGGSHLPDVTAITPIFVNGDARPSFFTASRAHHAEIGGIAPGSLPPSARSLAEEGVVIRVFRYRTDQPDASEAALRELLLRGPFPTRAVGENLADLRAQMAANQAGALLLAEWISQVGLARLEASAAELRRVSEQRVRDALATLAERFSASKTDGIAEVRRAFADQLDDGTPIVVTITLRADGSARFDFTGSGPVHPRNFNANRAIVTSAVIYCLRCLIDAPVPLNAGLLAPVEIVIPPGSLLDPPSDPDPARCPAVGAGNVETSQRLVDVILSALEVVAQSQGTMNNLLFGRGAREQGPAFGYYETIGGGAGAGPGFNGASAVHAHMTNTRLTDPEILEARYPVRLREWSIRRGSGGAGRYRGGDGMIRELEFLAPLAVSLLTNRRTTAPSGANGGQPGQPGRNLLRRAGETEFTELPAAGQISVFPGDVLRLETPGGGGWDPALCPPGDAEDIQPGRS